MAQKKRLTLAEKTTLSKIKTQWEPCDDLPLIHLATLVARGLIETNVSNQCRRVTK